MAEENSRDKLKKLLKDLFQFDTQDIDFGIYKILNYKRDQIAKFIENDLIAAAETAFKEYATANLADLKNEVAKIIAEIRRDFGDDTIDIHGRVLKHQDAPKIKEYLSKTGELKSAELSQAKVNDVYNHLYEFFSRYYDKGDFISKRRYGGKDKYSIPYNGEEAMLYWANQDQYYIKTGEYFKKYSFKAGAYSVHFVLRDVDVEVNNAKGEKRFFVLCDENPIQVDEGKKELEIFFNYRTLSEEETKKYGTRNTQEALTSSALNRSFSEMDEMGLGPGRELSKKVDDETTLLGKHLNTYVKRNTTDYFIHKNLKGFLERENDFYLKNEVMDITEIERMDEKNIHLVSAKVKVMREIATKIIDFLAQIEDFQKQLWEKKKFVISTEYCITLDLIDEKYYPEILKNRDQMEVWKKLYSFDFDEQFNTIKKTISHIDKSDEEKRIITLKQNPNLVIDTKFYNLNFKNQILDEIDNLDDKITGILINSDNYQALNLLLTKYKEKIKCCCIDPPYNTGGDGFLFKDGYCNSSWLSLMYDRLQLVKPFLGKLGIIFTNIDDNEVNNLIALKKRIFGEDSVENYIWNVQEEGTMPKTAKKTVRKEHEYIITAFKNEKILNKYYSLKYADKDWSNPDNDNRGPWMSANISRGSGDASGGTNSYTITNPKSISFTRDWSISEEEYKKLLSDNRIYFADNGNGVPRKKIFQNEPVESIQSSIFEGLKSSQFGSNEIKDMFSISILQYPKPTELIKRLCKIGSSNKDIILDFFAGSGTTGHAVLSLNKEDEGKRKFILVEMGQYFDTILKPRMLKVIYSNNWKNAQPQDNDGLKKQIIKYQLLEQYEDSLNNIVFKKIDVTIQETLYSYKDYFLRYMLDYETRESPTRLAIDKFQTPFDYRIKTLNGNEERTETVDLVETFNYLLGLHVEKLRAFKDEDRHYRVVFGKQETQKVAIIWRNTKDINLKKDKKFIEETILVGEKPNRIFVNGDSYVKNAEPIEPEFKKLMGA
jgi:adenine-specific DNA-methyltransferase